MGGSSETQKVVSGPTNPKVDETITQLLGGVQNAYNRGPQPFNESLYAGTGPTTRNAWAMGKGAANNADYNSGISGAMRYAGGLADGSGPSMTETALGGVARGDYLNNMDPEYQAMIDRAANETTADVNASIGADGRYGSNVHVADLVDQVGGMRTRANVENRRYEQQRQRDALGAIEGTRQQGVDNAFAAQQMLPQLLGAGQLPASILGDIGAAEDADRQAVLQGRYDLHERQNNAQTDLLAKLSSILAGNAASGGQSESTMTPIWQQLLGGGAAGAGIFGRMFGGR